MQFGSIWINLPGDAAGYHGQHEEDVEATEYGHGTECPYHVPQEPEAPIEEH